LFGWLPGPVSLWFVRLSFVCLLVCSFVGLCVLSVRWFVPVFSCLCGVCVCVRACSAYVCVHVRVRACGCVCVCVRMRVCFVSVRASVSACSLR